MVHRCSSPSRRSPGREFRHCRRRALEDEPRGRSGRRGQFVRRNADAPSRLSALGSRLSALGSRLSALGSRLSALGSRLSALGSRLSALGSRLSALGSRLSALGSRLSALGSRLSALGSRLSALGSRLSALGSRLSALGSRLSALGSRLSALGSRLSALALGSRLSALGSRLSALSTYGKTRVLPPRPAHPQHGRTSAPIRRRVERTLHRLLTVNEGHLFTPAGRADVLLFSGRFSPSPTQPPGSPSRGCRDRSSHRALGGGTTREPAEHARTIVPGRVKNSRWLVFRP